MRKPSRTAVVEQQQAPAPGAQAATSTAEGLWAIALLRVAMELKRPGAPGLDEIIDGVARRMGLAKADIERVITEQVGRLEEEVERKGFAR